MENSYRILLDLLSLRQARVENDCIIIPVSANGIRLTKSKKDESKLYASMMFNVISRKSTGEHGEVAIVKPVLTFEERNKLMAGMDPQVPIVGNVLLKKSE